jgi:hypothetical protein
MATPAQVGLIKNLLAERDVPEDFAATATAVCERPDILATLRTSREIIDPLYAYPRKPRPAAAASRVPSHLEGLPGSNYAFRWESLHTVGVEGLAGHNNMAFFRVKQWRDRVYLDQLHGAPGSFSRTRLTAAQEVAVAGLIRLSPQAAAFTFATHYKRCARCGAELTEQSSRDIGLGPTCKGYFGL